MPEILPRHSLVTPIPAAWATYLDTRPDLSAEPLIAGWVSAGYPLIVRRHIGAESDDLIPLGLPLPPARGKRRIAVTIARTDILHISPPPLLSEAATAAPASWQDSIARLIELDPAVRCFGSLAWQYLTGLAYVSTDSDLDLLWQMPPTGCNALLSGIAAIADTAPLRIDGEILNATGGVNWRELHVQDGGDVLLKGSHQVRMMTRHAFLAGAIS